MRPLSVTLKAGVDMKPDTIIELINVCLEAMIIIFYLYGVMKDSYKFKKSVLVFADMILTSALLLATFIFDNPWVQLFLTFLVMLIVSMFLFECRFIRKLFYAFVFAIIILGSEIIPMALLYVLNLGTPMELLTFGIGRIIGIVSSKIICFWMTVFIVINLRTKIKEIPAKNWIAIILTPVLSIVILNCIFVSENINRRHIMTYVIAVSGLVALNFFVFDFFDTYAKQLKLALMEKQLKSEQENYSLIETKYLEIRQLKHDMRNQIEIANELIKNNEMTGALTHLTKLSDELSNVSGICYTGIPAIDSIINIKWQEAVSKNINYMSKVTVLEKFETDLLDLCRILSNALDNAVEACDKFEGEEKFIYIIFHAADRKLHISVMNSANKVDVNDLRTTKLSGGPHGIGIGSIRNSAERLGGIVTFNWSDNVFTIDLLLNY
jgi:hypothetical protein